MLSIAATLGPLGSAISLPPTHGAVAAEAIEMATARAGPSVNCSDPVLTSFLVTPTAAEVMGLHTQDFAATAVGSCGVNLTQGTTVNWALSSGALGTLSSSTGASTTYTACLAPMSGLLRVTGSFQGVTLQVNVSIVVSYASAGGPNSPGGPNGGTATPGDLLSAGKWLGWSVAAILVVAGTALAVRTQRQQKASRAGPSVPEGAPADPAAPPRERDKGS